MNKLTKNVCKFSPSQDIESEINIINFVFEKNTEILTNEIIDGTYKLHYTLAKEKIEYQGKVYELGKNVLFFTFPTKKYRYLSKNPKEYYISFIGKRALKLVNDYIGTEDKLCYFQCAELQPIFENAILIDNDSIAYSGEGIILFVFSLIANSIKPKSNDDHLFIYEIKKYVDVNFRNENLTLKFVAQKYNYNIGYISTVFKNKIGLSFCDYVNTLRLNFSQSLITSGYTNVSDIAFLSGFNSREYFSKLFIKKYKISPKKQIILNAKK